MRSTTVLEIPAAEQEALRRQLRQARYGHLLAIHILLLCAAGLNSRLPSSEATLPQPTRICFVGDGTLLEFDTFWRVIMASGTDAVLRYYIEGDKKAEIEAALRSFINLRI